MTEFVIKREAVADKIDAVWGLLERHRSELTTRPDLMVLKPDRERYEALEAAGALYGLFAYLGGEIVGYSVNFLTNNLHYADLSYMQNDVLFVDQPFRKSRLGCDLIAKTENMAAELGARMMIWHCKEGTNLQALLPRLGYGVQDIIMSKVL